MRHAVDLPVLPLAALSVGAVGAAGLGATGALGPGDVGPVPCLFHAATGLPCPFCGLTRSVAAFGAGDPAAAVAVHPLGPLALVLAVALLVAVAQRAAASKRPVSLHVPAPALGALALAVLLSWPIQLVRFVP